MKQSRQEVSRKSLRRNGKDSWERLLPGLVSSLLLLLRLGVGQIGGLINFEPFPNCDNHLAEPIRDNVSG